MTSSNPGSVAVTSTVLALACDAVRLEGTAQPHGSTLALSAERPGAFVDVEEGEESTEDEPALDLAII